LSSACAKAPGIGLSSQLYASREVPPTAKSSQMRDYVYSTWSDALPPIPYTLDRDGIRRGGILQRRHDDAHGERRASSSAVTHFFGMFD
jgi:hypothetical protein